MATYRQIPEVFRRLHPRFKTPWLSLVLFAGSRADPGDPARGRQLRRHALLVRRDAVVHGRPRVARPAADAAAGTRRSSTAPGRTFASAGIDWPLFALVRRARDRRSRSSSSSSRTRSRAGSGSAGSPPGSSSTSLYRRRVVHAPLTETVKAPPAYGPALALEYRRLLVPVSAGTRVGRGARRRCEPRGRARRADHGRLRARGAARARRSRRSSPSEEQAANRELDEARAIGESYGVAVIPRLVRARQRGRRDRRGGGAARQRDHRHRRAAEGARPPQARRLRAHRRLRAQERALPGDGDRARRRRREPLPAASSPSSRSSSSASASRCSWSRPQRAAACSATSSAGSSSRSGSDG